MEMGVGEVIIGVSPPAIGVSGGGSRLAQITVAGGFSGRDSTLRRISPLFFGCGGKKRERKNAKMYHSLRVDWSHRLRKTDISFLRNKRKDRRVDSIPSATCTQPLWRGAGDEGDEGWDGAS